jgi:HSP20 family protein
MFIARKHHAKQEEKGLARHGDGDRTEGVNPYGLMRRFNEDMDRLFERFGPGNMLPFFGRGGEWMPDIDVVERNNAVVIRADLPGLTRKDVKVEVTGSTVTIEGERTESHEEESHGYYRNERRYGHFSRTVPLPAGTKPDGTKASFSNGVLEVTIPAEGHVSRRRIEVEAGNRE